MRFPLWGDGFAGRVTWESDVRTLPKLVVSDGIRGCLLKLSAAQRLQSHRSGSGSEKSEKQPRPSESIKNTFLGNEVSLLVCLLSSLQVLIDQLVQHAREVLTWLGTVVHLVTASLQGPANHWSTPLRKSHQKAGY